MKKLSGVALVAGIVVAVAAVAGGTVYVANRYLATMAKANAPVACPVPGINHVATMRGSSVTPQHTAAKLCDTLTIVNADAPTRLVAFGPHDHHEAYDGVLEQPLSRGQRLTITLDKAGTYSFHDHLQDEVVGDFTVSK